MSEDNRDQAMVHIDRGLMGLLERTATVVSPQHGRAIFNGGLGEVVKEFLHEQGVPRGGVPLVDIARQVGILKPKGRK